MRGGAHFFEKRQRELARQKRQKEKAERKIQRKAERAGARPADGEDPDIAGIVPGPQAVEDPGGGPTGPTGESKP